VGSNDGGAEPRLTRTNSISYIQLPAVDGDQSADFYERIFGWSIRGRGTSHVSFDDASGYVSGAWVTDRTISSEPGVLPYIYVDGIDETLRQVVTHGGKIVTPPYPEGGLWVATFRDPAGNVIGVWQMGPR
jgi:predicted enzyme related to lactoylglutathione lyase